LARIRQPATKTPPGLGTLFYEFASRIWWAGDALPHRCPNMHRFSRLEEALSSGKFSSPAEIAPPAFEQPEEVIKKVELLKGWVDAANLPCTLRYARMSSAGLFCDRASKRLEPVLQIAGRDRTRTGYQFRSSRRLRLEFATFFASLEIIRAWPGPPQPQGISGSRCHSDDLASSPYA